ncbi:MAG: type-F conjugative transfer system pilin assembly protein TrbC [Rickettsiaceae bacterium]|jgi:type-F conjugative transfer system pilin assembly protein TrbC|nr:type-F conjugative transfer system pilin assembly protein TrbC [Rickettsiaceae bacterium]
MAKKKLLLVLGLMLSFSVNTRAEERFEFIKEDMEFAHDLAALSSKISMNGLKEEWLKLQEMQREKNDQGDDGLDLAPISPRESEHGLKIFVSSSMGNSLLKTYLSQAKLYKATLVFNGLPGGSWRKLSQLVYELTDGEEEGVSMQIDDLAFVEYGITSVPAIVLQKEIGVFEYDELNSAPVFDKVTGNIGIRRGLELIAQKGELSTLATQILDEAKASR